MAEFFLMPVFINKTTRTILDISNKPLLNLILEKVSIHFEHIKVNETQIRMTILKTESEKLLINKIKNKLINPHI